MAIRALSRQEFERFASAQSALEDLTAKAVEWFADDSGLILGAIAHHRSDLNWSFVVLSRDCHASFRAKYLDFGFWNADEARRQLFLKMDPTEVNASSANSISVPDLIHDQ
jgi:hypothetical protein